MEQEIFIDTLTRKIRNLEFKFQLKGRSNYHVVDKSQNSSDIVQTNQFCLKKRDFENFEKSMNKEKKKINFKFKMVKSDKNNLILTDFFDIDKKKIQMVQSEHIPNGDVANSDDVMMSDMSQHAKSIQDSVFKIDNLINSDAHSLPPIKNVSQKQQKIVIPPPNPNVLTSTEHLCNNKDNKCPVIQYTTNQEEDVLPIVDDIGSENNDRPLEIIKSPKPNEISSLEIKEIKDNKEVFMPLLDRLSLPVKPQNFQVKELHNEKIIPITDITNPPEPAIFNHDNKKIVTITDFANPQKSTKLSPKNPPQTLKKNKKVENIKKVEIEKDTQLLPPTPKSKPKPSIPTEQIKHLILLSEKPYSPDFQSTFTIISKKINELLKLTKPKKSNFLFSCKESRNLKKYSLTNNKSNITAANLISINTISICLILILFKHKNLVKADWAEEIFSLISNICLQNANIENNFCFRILNAIFKKSVHDISLDDIKQKKISNSFGYLIMIFNELMYLLESQIIPNMDISINNSQFSQIKKNSLFKQFALSNLKMLPSNFHFPFFTNIHDLFFSIELVSSFPSVIWSNHNKFELLRNLFRNHKFKFSIQRLLCLQISQLIPLSDDVKNNFPLIK